MKQFKEPEILVEQLEVQDVITTSGVIEEPENVKFTLRANQTPFG